VFILVQISFDELLVVNKNQKGVHYMEVWDSKEVVAKQCTNCNSWKFLDEFNKAGKGFAGTHSLCRSCHKGRNKELQQVYKDNKHLTEEVARELYKMANNELHQIRRSITFRNW
jgi:hypothetical protein